MQTYSDFQPTAFDHKGAFLCDQGAWLVAPCGRTRDSGPLEESNFAACLAMLGGESDSVEVRRFGHWGPGWYEIIIVDPESPKADIARDIESKLEDYPLLDDCDCSGREFECAAESWEFWGFRDFIKAIARHHELSDSAEDLLSGWDSDNAFRFYCNHAGEPYYSEGSGVSFPRLDDAAGVIGRADCARLLRHLRNGNTDPYKG